MPIDNRPLALSRRRFLEAAALGSIASLLAACDFENRSPGPTSAPSDASRGATASPTPSASAPASPGPTASPASAATGRVLYRNAALADARSARLRYGVSVLVANGRIAWIRPADGEGSPGPRDGLEVIDARGATLVPGMVDAHSHLTLPGGANWLDRILDPPERLLKVAERNGELAIRAGIRWFRDVGSPTVTDPVDGRRRALAIGVRDRWAGRRDRPYVRSAGSWLAPVGVLPPGAAVDVRNADELLAAALRQLDQGADPVKLYVQSPDPDSSPWSAAEIRRVVDAVHRRKAKVAAHVQRLEPARAPAGGVPGVHPNRAAVVPGPGSCRSWDAVLDGRRPPLRNGPPARRRGERPDGSGGGCQDRRRDRLRGWLIAGESARLGGAVAGRGRTRAVGGTRVGHVAWRPAAR